MTKSKKMARVTLGFIVCFVLIASFSAGSALAGTFPSKAIRILVPYGVGGTTDMITRALCAVAPAYLNDQSLIAVVKPGAGGAIASAYHKKQPASGYLLINVSPGGLTAKPQVTDTGYTWEDFEPIAYIGDDPYVFSVHADSPFNTMEELLAYAKKNPGKLKFAACAPGTLAHLTVEYFQMITGVKVTYVPYKCFGPSAAALLGKHVDMAAPGPASVTPHIQAGKLRALAVSAGKRRGTIDAPAMTELGYPIPFMSWKAILAKKGIKREEKDFLVKAFKDIIHDKSFLAMMKRLNQPVSYKGPEYVTELCAKETEVIKDLVKKLGLRKK
jgi:tripartite-type tricarboxylate transporter receptor subunit TctC